MNYKIIITSLLLIVSCTATDKKTSIESEGKKTAQEEQQAQNSGQFFQLKPKWRSCGL